MADTKVLRPYIVVDGYRWLSTSGPFRITTGMYLLSARTRITYRYVIWGLTTTTRTFLSLDEPVWFLRRPKSHQCGSVRIFKCSMSSLVRVGKEMICQGSTDTYLHTYIHVRSSARMIYSILYCE